MPISFSFPNSALFDAIEDPPLLDPKYGKETMNKAKSTALARNLETLDSAAGCLITKYRPWTWPYVWGFVWIKLNAMGWLNWKTSNYWKKQITVRFDFWGRCRIDEERYEQEERERGKLKQGEREFLASAKSGSGVITTHKGYTRGLNSWPQEHQLPHAKHLHGFSLSVPRSMAVWFGPKRRFEFLRPIDDASSETTRPPIRETLRRSENVRNLVWFFPFPLICFRMNLWIICEINGRRGRERTEELVWFNFFDGKLFGILGQEVEDSWLILISIHISFAWI